MAFKEVKQIHPIGAMKIYTKPNCKLCMWECLTILKKLHDKRVTVMNNNLIYMVTVVTNNFPSVLSKHC